MNTKKFSAEISVLRRKFDEADAVLVGAGAGLSTSAGLTYSGERFEKNFGDFREKYGIRDMYSGGFFPFKTMEEFWAWWSRQIYCNRYESAENETYKNLLRAVGKKNYFVITTNVDHQFQKASFDKKRLFYTQGDYGLFQCSKPCCQKTYDNRESVEKMIHQQKDMKIPSELIPRCPVCGALMSMNLRSDDTFVQDEGWYEAQNRYAEFLDENEGKKIVLLELGVGMNTPGIIKYPFWRMTQKNPRAFYVCINRGESFCPGEIKNRSLCVDGDIAEFLAEFLG